MWCVTTVVKQGQLRFMKAGVVSEVCLCGCLYDKVWHMRIFFQ